MAQLGDVLERIHASPQRLQTARLVGSTAGRRWRLWWAGDDRYRMEDGGGANVRVRHGAMWWLVDADGRAHSNEGRPTVGLGAPPEFALLHTRGLLAAAMLEVAGEDVVAGRPAVIVRATPRPGSPHSRWWDFGESVEPIEIPIDVEVGAALAGPHIRVEEAVFGERLSPELFERPYPAGQAAPPPVLMPRAATLDEVRELADFPVVVPVALPRGARLLRCVVDPQDRVDWVGLSWAIDPGHVSSLHLRQGPAVDQEARQHAGNEVRHAGLRVRSVPDGLDRHVLIEVDGRWYEFASDLSLETVLDVAGSLRDRS